MPAIATDQDGKIREWLDAGLISTDQAAAIRRHEAAAGTTEAAPPAPPAPPDDLPVVVRDGAPQRRVPLLGEALGYLGAALVAIAGTILLAEHWDRLLFGAKLALIAVLGTVLFSAGAYLRDVAEPAAQRLAGFTWALTVGAVAWFVGLATGRDGLSFAGETQALSVAVAAAIVASAMWWRRSRWQQHLVAAAAVLATLITLLTLPASEPEVFFFGVAIAALGLIWLLLAQAGLLPPASVGRVVGLVLLVGGLRVMPGAPYEGLGLVLALLATAGLLTAGVMAEAPLLLGFGAAGVFLFVPQAVFHFFGETLGAPVALLLIGFVLIGTALLVVRARADREVMT